MTLTTFAPVFAGALLAATATAATAQTPAPQRLELGVLHRAAVDTDPRLRELTLRPAQSELRVKNIETSWYPSISVEGQLQSQSDVPTPPTLVPGGTPLFLPPKNTYDASVHVEQRIVDSTVAAQLSVEKAQLAEDQARVRTALFALRQEVNEAFFTAALLQERAGALAATITDLEARLSETATRVREGAALPSDAAAIEASLLQRRQDAAELRVDRRTALSRLGLLTGRTIGEADVLVLPDLGSDVVKERAAAAARARPEYDQFARTRDRLAQQQAAADAQVRPRVSAYGRAGLGYPGLNVIGSQPEFYALGGVQLQWRAWTWGASTREHDAYGIQQQIVLAEEESFTKSLARTSDGDLAAIDRLESTMSLDDRIVSLREDIDRTTQARFREGVATSSESVDRSTDLLQARFARAGHVVELAQARARYLTTLGLEVR